ncbi:hypothetical protein ACTI_76380 [Actinoplanes sp. OR16]|uniref:hypothetical protein n=1 Tax=Actinoplanes sp. OR16 TaxID=946334 RepID=UPI000F6BE02A|nr:hypothetical protein [Actinoplanes sp. OR16]BBH70953.1 hypothetical protein ACTI_76380 [Actinoplanes sp. OR16]
MTEDDLRARIREADPAASLAALSPDEATRLVETTMTMTTTAVNRRRHYALAAAALVLVLGGTAWALTRPEEKTVQLTGPAGIAAKCVEPTAERLAASADLAFAGTVTALTPTTVTLDVTRVYTGGEVGRAEVSQTGETSEQLMGTGKFESGKDYLVASSAGAVMICGYSGEATTPGLAGLYEKAFPR